MQIVDDDEVIYKPLETVLLEGPWHNGRIVLLGDAAHATTPHLGQGAGMAIEDAVVLAEEIEGADAPEEAFLAYHARRFERCKLMFESSVAIGEFQMGKRDDVDIPALTRRMAKVTAAPI